MASHHCQVSGVSSHWHNHEPAATALATPHLALCAASVASRLLEVSPISHAHHIVAPLLLLVGLKDKRVPPSQSVELYYQLQRRGSATTQLLAFPDDGHPLDKPVTEAECWLAIVAWMDRWLV